MERNIKPQIKGLLESGPVVINIGVTEFAETLRKQSVPVVLLEWSPPAGGDPEMIRLLDQIL